MVVGAAEDEERAGCENVVFVAFETVEGVVEASTGILEVVTPDCVIGTVTLNLVVVANEERFDVCLDM